MTLLLLSFGTIIPQCCLRGELFKFLHSWYHQVHEYFKGSLMFKYLKTSSAQLRFWVTLNLKEIWAHLFSNSFPPHKKRKMLWLPMSLLPPSSMRYQNVSPLIKPHALIFQYIFIFSYLRMQSVQGSEWLRSTQRFWSRQKKMW